MSRSEIFERARTRQDPPDVVVFPSGWLTWWDVFRGYPIGSAVVVVCMLAVIVADGLWLANATGPDTAALMNGIAAVVTAIACIIEAKRGNEARDQLADHEARLRVLEDRGTRTP